jgi:predicted outer membrane repeat protein
VSQTTFTTNTATAGGAIENWTGASLTVYPGTTFGGNRAQYGGAIDSYYGATTLALSGASFTDNIASNFGGAINNHSGATLSGCTFTGNQSLGAAYPSGGGAIWNDGMLTVQGNSSFVDNTANFVGGAISNFGTATVSQTAFTNSGSTPGNSAQFGGAIMNWTGANLTVNPGTSFTNNTASQTGGAIFSYGTLDATGTSFTSNTALLGGAIINYGTLDATGTSFTSNTAISGGAIINYGTVTTSGGSFSNNQATNGYGGAIYNAGTLSASGTSFTSNTALDGGAIINHFDATVSGCTFTTNRSTGVGYDYDGGGAIWSNWSLTVQDNCNFFTNTAAADGGAIFDFAFLGDAATVTVSQSAFEGNSAYRGGAIENWTGTTLTVNAGTIFTGNHATFVGGAIENRGTLSATGANFAGNHVDGAGGGAGGGAIENFFGSATLTSCGFSDNKSALYGGAIDNEAGGMTLSGCQLTSNSAIYGGAISNLSGVLNVVSGCDIYGNNATSGGGIFTPSGVATVSNSIFSSNTPDNIFGPYTDGGGNTVM